MDSMVWKSWKYWETVSAVTLKKTAVYEWHERFKSSHESVEDDERSGRPSTSKTDENINKVREIFNDQ